jgi:hypothetical protein
MKLAARCPNCDYPFEAAVVRNELRAGTHPQPGDVLVCIGCGLWSLLEVDSQVESRLVVRELTAEELLRLPASSLELMRKATKAIELIRDQTMPVTGLRRWTAEHLPEKLHRGAI